MALPGGRELITACAEFRRLDALLKATPCDDAAWESRQKVAMTLASLRPVNGGRLSREGCGRHGAVA
jgi:hypothetical protein